MADRRRDLVLPLLEGLRVTGATPIIRRSKVRITAEGTSCPTPPISYNPNRWLSLPFLRGHRLKCRLDRSDPKASRPKASFPPRLP